MCMEDHPVSWTAKLACGHRMCNPCIKQLFKRSLTDPSDMPPRCCTAEPIALEHVEAMFDDDFKRTWNATLVEVSARGRTSCPSKKCGEQIRQGDFRVVEGNRRMAQCARCRTKVCGGCRGRWHSSKKCPRENLAEMREEGVRCYRCKSTVADGGGHNQVTW